MLWPIFKIYMQLTMLHSRYASEDGFRLCFFQKYHSYEIADSLARELLRQEIAKPTNCKGSFMTSNRKRLLTPVSTPTSEPVTLAEVKQYLRVNYDDEDALISDMIVSARIAAEQYLKRSLMLQSWKLAYDDFIPDQVELPMGPINSITSVTVYNRDNSTQVADSSTYYLNAARDKLVLYNSLFGLYVGNGSRIEIIYEAGYTSANTIPKPIKLGLLAHILCLYDHRGVMNGDPVPAQAAQLYAPYREVRI